MNKEIEFKRVDLGDGVVYEGEIENGTRFVFGKYSLPNITYIGEFNEESDMEGIGKLTTEYTDGLFTSIVNVGTFKGKTPNGFPLLNGYGADYYFLNSNSPDFEKATELNGGIKYQEGKFVDGNLHGQGTIYYNDGGKYEGGVAHGKMHGKGRKTQADGTTVLREYDNGRALFQRN